MFGFIKTGFQFHELDEGVRPMFGSASMDYLADIMSDADACNDTWFQRYLADKNIVGVCLQDFDTTEDKYEDVRNIAPILTADPNTLMIIIECCNLTTYLDEDAHNKIKEIFGEYGFKEYEGVYESKIVFQRGLGNG